MRFPIGAHISVNQSNLPLECTLATFANQLCFISPLGWMDSSSASSFPWTNPNTGQYIGSGKGSFALASQTGSIGHQGVWKAYFGRKIRRGDTIGTVLDGKAGTIRFLLRSLPSRNLPDVAPPTAFSIDASKVYHAAVSLKYAQTYVEAHFKHPFALWDMVADEVGRPPLFAPLVSVPFRLVTPIYNSALPIALASTDPVVSLQDVGKAIKSYEENTVRSLLLVSLPFETILHIMTFIDVTDIPAASRTCRIFYETCAHHQLWNDFVERDFHFGLGISTQKYFTRLMESERGLRQSSAIEDPYPDPYAENLPTASAASKDRYRKKYNWHNARYESLPSIPTEWAVDNLSFDQDKQRLFYSAGDNFYVYSFESGEVSQGLFSAIGDIVQLKYASGYLVLATDAGFLHVIDENGSQVARIANQFSRVLCDMDVYVDYKSGSLVILAASKTKGLCVWSLGGVTEQSASTTEPLMLSDVEQLWTNSTFHTRPLVAVSFIPESGGKFFVSASNDGVVAGWTLDEMPLRASEDSSTPPSWSWKMPSASSVAELTCMSLSSEGWFGAVGTSSGEILVFDTKQGGSLLDLPVISFGSIPGTVGGSSVRGRPITKRSSRWIIDIHYECGGKLITTMDDNTIRLWNQSAGLPDWSHQASRASSLLCTEDYLIFGTSGRVSMLDFSMFDLTEEQREKSLEASCAYLRNCTQTRRA